MLLRSVSSCKGIVFHFRINPFEMLDEIMSKMKALYKCSLHDPVFGVKCIVGEEGKKKLEDKEKMKYDQRKRQKDKGGEKVKEMGDTFKEEDTYISESGDNFGVDEQYF